MFIEASVNNIQLRSHILLSTTPSTATHPKTHTQTQSVLSVADFHTRCRLTCLLGVVDQPAHAKRLCVFTMHFYFTVIPRLCSTFNHSFPLLYTLSLQFFLFILFPVLVSLSHSLLFSQYVCALGVEFSLSARHSLIIQRSAGIHQLLRGSPRFQRSTGCYLSIHPSIYPSTITLSLLLHLHGEFAQTVKREVCQPSKQCHIKECSCKSADLKPWRLIGRSPNEGDRMRTRWGWFFIQQHNKQHMLLQHCRKGRGHRQTEELNMSRVEVTPTYLLCLLCLALNRQMCMSQRNLNIYGHK